MRPWWRSRLGLLMLPGLAGCEIGDHLSPDGGGPVHCIPFHTCDGGNIVDASDAGPPIGGDAEAGQGDAEAPLTEPVVDIRHDGTSSTAHVVDRRPSPAAGDQTLFLPVMATNVQVFADGVPLAIEQDPNASSSGKVIRISVPAGAGELRVEYDQLDASLPYEGLWYLENQSYVGPARVSIVLPPDAVVDRYDGSDTDPNPTRLVFELAPGESVSTFVAYRTPTVPDLYDYVLTRHFEIRIPQAYRAYEDMVLGLLENAYVLYGYYSGQDVAEIQGFARYPFWYPPPRWRWFGSGPELGGGLSTKGLSTVNARLIPQVGLPTSDGFNLMVAISLHELGNGWWGLWESSDPSNRPPQFIDNEGHSGFLRAQAELDLGYCADAQREHSGHYADFVNCTNNCPAEIPLDSLVAVYGWSPLRAYYAAIQNGDFDFRGLDELAKNGIVVRFLSEQVGENLAPFYESIHVSVPPDVASDLAARLPPSRVRILEQLTCRPPVLRVANTIVDVDLTDGQTRSSRAFVCSPGGFSARVQPDGALAVTTTATPNCGVANVSVLDPLAKPGILGCLIVSGTGVLCSPRSVPVRAVAAPNLLQNSGFEQGAEQWEPITFNSDAVLSIDGTIAHSGSSSARIYAPTPNDARFIQSLALAPNTNYLLSGFIRTEGVQETAAGANLTAEWPGQGWSNSRAITGTRDFSYVFMTFRNTTQPSVDIEARLGHYGTLTSGTAWYDDLRLQVIP